LVLYQFIAKIQNCQFFIAIIFQIYTIAYISSLIIKRIVKEKAGYAAITLTEILEH
jgi:hypothetical protein